MKRADLTNFIEENKLLNTEVHAVPGIYAITIDDYIVYVGQSINVRQRCMQHIYSVENAGFNQEKKYLLLLSAKLGGHKVDCVGLEYIRPEQLSEYEANYINKYKPILNIIIPGEHKHEISDLKIEDVLGALQHKVIDKENKYEY